MIDALSAADSAYLAQMTACVYYKPGGLCRYGGDDPANVCVLGPCPYERTAEEVLADLARMTAERDAAITDLRKWSICITCIHYNPHGKKSNCKVKEAYLPGGNWAGCSKWKWRGIKED